MTDTTLDHGAILSSNFFATSSSQNYSKESDLEHEDSGKEPPKEQGLWQSVIMQAILDATLAPINQKARKIKTQAIIWLSITNKDFLLVCEMADMDPLYVIRGAKSSIRKSTVIHRRKKYMQRLRNVKKEHTDNHIPADKIQSYVSKIR